MFTPVTTEINGYLLARCSTLVHDISQKAWSVMVVGPSGNFNSWSSFHHYIYHGADKSGVPTSDLLANMQTSSALGIYFQ